MFFEFSRISAVWQQKCFFESGTILWLFVHLIPTLQSGALNHKSKRAFLGLSLLDYLL